MRRVIWAEPTVLQLIFCDLQQVKTRCNNMGRNYASGSYLTNSTTFNIASTYSLLLARRGTLC
jgi:hypothetical protein